jgi:hypothetical protein
MSRYYVIALDSIEGSQGDPHVISVDGDWYQVTAGRISDVGARAIPIPGARSLADARERARRLLHALPPEERRVSPDYRDPLPRHGLRYGLEDGRDG